MQGPHPVFFLNVNYWYRLLVIDFINKKWDGWDSNPGPKP